MPGGVFRAFTFDLSENFARVCFKQREQSRPGDGGDNESKYRAISIIKGHGPRPISCRTAQYYPYFR